MADETPEQILESWRCGHTHEIADGNPHCHDPGHRDIVCVLATVAGERDKAREQRDNVTSDLDHARAQRDEARADRDRWERRAGQLAKTLREVLDEMDRRAAGWVPRDAPARWRAVLDEVDTHSTVITTEPVDPPADALKAWPVGSPQWKVIRDAINWRRERDGAEPLGERYAAACRALSRSVDDLPDAIDQPAPAEVDDV
jgi:hypothetical protein